MPPAGRKHDSSGEVRDILNAIRRLVRTLRVSARAAEQEVGLSGAQLFVLQTIGKTDALTLGALAERTITDPSSVSVVVGRLVARGLVKRKRDPEDARRLRLSLTASGRTIFRRAPDAAQERLLEALGKLPAAQQRTLAKLLVVLTAEMGLEGGEAPMMFDEEPPARRRAAR
jgi:DNA-binding MarR family transcriptional regulator